MEVKRHAEIVLKFPYDMVVSVVKLHQRGNLLIGKWHAQEGEITGQRF